MAKSVKGTQTELNLLKAFAGESQARNRYTYFAGAARRGWYRLRQFLKKLQLRRRSTPSVFINVLKAEKLPLPIPTRYP